MEAVTFSIMGFVKVVGLMFGVIVLFVVGAMVMHRRAQLRGN